MKIKKLLKKYKGDKKYNLNSHPGIEYEDDHISCKIEAKDGLYDEIIDDLEKILNEE